MASTIGKLLVELGLDDSDFTGGLKRATSSLETLQKGGKKFSESLDSAVTGSLQAAGLALAAFGAATVKVGVDFEQAIKTVGAVAGATGEPLERLTKKARELGAATIYTATDAANAMQSFARAGMDVNEILLSSGPALTLAAGGATDMATATELTAATLAQFGLDANSSARVADVFSTALRKSLFDVDSLREAMKYAGTAGAGLGYSLEQTTAAVAMFRNLGLEGSMAGTNFRMAMMTASNATAKAEKVLTKYGLTVKDINPETHNFAEIMETVGKVSMTTSDAIKVFGVRAGANVAMIAREFAGGTTDYYKLLNQLENSTGSAQRLYEDMTDTVLGRFKIMVSAAEEMMLSLFDTMKGPLADLLDELGTTIAYVAQVFNRESGSIGSSFEEMVGKAVAWLRENREMIAVTFIDFVKSLRDAIALLVQMVPVLVTIAQTMALVWVADKVRLFVIGIQTTITALAGMSGGIRAVMASLTAATGGVYAVVAAVGTLVAGILYLVSANNEAEEATERLRKAEDKLDKERAARAKRQKAQADALAGTQALYAGQISMELLNRGELTHVLDGQISRLQGLSSSAIEAGIASGELFEATVNGTKIVLDHATAVELAADGTVFAAQAQEAFEKQLQKAKDAVRDKKYEVERLTKTEQSYTKAIEAGNSESAARKVYISDSIGDIETLRATLEETKKEEDALRAKAESLARGHQVAIDALGKRIIQEKVAKNATDELANAEGRGGKAAKKAADEAIKAYEARLRAVERIEEAIAKRRAPAEEQAALAMNEQLEEIGKVFDTEIAAYGKQTDKIAAAVLERGRIEGEIRKDAAEQLQREQQALLDKYRDEAESASVDASDRETYEVKKRQKERIAELQLAFAKEKALYKKKGDEVLQITLFELLAAQRLYETFAVEDAARLAAKRLAVQESITATLIQDERARNNELENIELDRIDAILGTEEASAEQIAQINAIYDRRIVKQKQDMHNDVELLTAGEYRRVKELEIERDEWLRRLGADQTEERAKVIKYFGDEIDKATKEAEKKTVTTAKKIAAAVQTVGKAVSKVALLIANGIGSAVNGVYNLFTGLTGFSFDLLGAVSKVNDGMTEIADLQKQLAAGEISVADYEAKLAELPATAAAGAVSFVEELVSGSKQMLSTFTQAAPALLQELAVQLPSLIQQFATALPNIASSLAASFGDVVEAIAGQAPVVMQALANSIGVLVNALITSLPTIVQGLLDAIVAMLPALSQALVGIVDIASLLLQGVIAALPEVLTALVGIVVKLVPALVDALLMVLQALIAELPSIMQALMDGVMQLLVMVFAELPKILTTIFDAIPFIIASLMKGITLMLNSIVQQLPMLIEALLVGFIDVVVSLIAMVPTLIAAIVAMLPDLLSAVIDLIPAVVQGLANALPKIVTAVIGLIPTLIVAIIQQLIPALIFAIPQLLEALMIQLPMALGTVAIELAKAIGIAVWEGLQVLGRFFSDVIEELITLGMGETATFGDTPGAVRAGTSGLSARFAPGDYVVAAQRPTDLLRQALDAMQGQFAAGMAPAARGYAPGELEVPAAAGLASAMLQAATAMQQGAPGAGGPGGAQRLQVVVQANGRTLDEALFVAGRRGEAPRLSQELRRSSLRAGVHVGFDRGKFSS